MAPEIKARVQLNQTQQVEIKKSHLIRMVVTWSFWEQLLSTYVENNVAEVSVFSHGVEGGEGVGLLLLVLDDEVVLRRNAVVVVRLQRFRGQFHLLHHRSLQLQSVHCQFCNDTSRRARQTHWLTKYKLVRQTRKCPPNWICICTRPPPRGAKRACVCYTAFFRALDFSPRRRSRDRSLCCVRWRFWGERLRVTCKSKRHADLWS